MDMSGDDRSFQIHPGDGLLGLAPSSAPRRRDIRSGELPVNTPESTALAVASALGQLLFVGGLIGVHLVYGQRYGLIGRIVVWTLGVLTVVGAARC